MRQFNGLELKAAPVALRPKIGTLAIVAALILAMPPGTPAAWSQTQSVQISSQPILLVEPSVETAFPIQLSDSTQLPKQAFVRIRGLPAAAVLSEGHAIKAGTWAVPLTGLANLMVTVAAASSASQLRLVGCASTAGAAALSACLAATETRARTASGSVARSQRSDRPRAEERRQGPRGKACPARRRELSRG